MDLSRAITAEITIPCPPGRDFRPYQRAGIAFAVEQLKRGRRGVLIADEPGLGKTAQAIGVANCIGARRILVISPATLKVNWSREFQMWLAAPKRILIAESKTAAWKFEQADISIVNYDVLSRHMDWRTSVNGIQVLSPGALDLDWDLLIADEVHVCKNVKSQRGALTLALAEYAKRSLFLTGTPIVNRPLELFPLINALVPGD